MRPRPALGIDHALRQPRQLRVERGVDGAELGLEAAGVGLAAGVGAHVERRAGRTSAQCACASAPGARARASAGVGVHHQRQRCAPGITSRAAVHGQRHQLLRRRRTSRSACAPPAARAPADLLAQRLVLSRRACGERGRHGWRCRRARPRGLRPGLRAKPSARAASQAACTRASLRALQLEHASRSCCASASSGTSAARSTRRVRGDAHVTLALPQQETHASLLPQGRSTRAISDCASGPRHLRRRGRRRAAAAHHAGAAARAASRPAAPTAPAPRSAGATCSPVSMRGLGATLCGSDLRRRASARSACRNGAPTAARAAFRRAPSIHRRSDGAHSIAPTWHSKRFSSSSGSASHVGARVERVPVERSTASGARWRSRRAIAARWRRRRSR